MKAIQIVGLSSKQDGQAQSESTYWRLLMILKTTNKLMQHTQKYFTHLEKSTLIIECLYFKNKVIVAKILTAAGF